MERTQLDRHVKAGEELSEAQVTDFEQRLLHKPDDLAVRVQLLAYHAKKWFDHETSSRPLYRGHALWVLEHQPELASPLHIQMMHLEAEGYETARDLWLRHIEQRPDDVDLLASAGEFFTGMDRGQAEALYERVQAVEPWNPAWPARLGHLHWIDYWMAVNSCTKTERVESARRALAFFEAAHALRDDTDEDRFYGLENLAQMAFESGETDKARRYADEFLHGAVGREEDDFYGNAIHYGHIVLGRIALRDGDITKAKEHLLAAGATPGSPTLNSYGPDLILAQELVEHGDREAFLEYGRRCAHFWSMRGSCLERWAATVEQGGIPDFQLDRLLDGDERPTG